MIQRPVAVGLLLCEQAIIEEKSRNVTPVNCFTRRFVEHLPSENLTFTVLAFLTDGLGELELSLVIENLDGGTEIYQRTSRVQFENPLSEYRLSIRVRNCKFPGPGDYQATLLAQNEFIAHRKFHVLTKEDQP